MPWAAKTSRSHGRIHVRIGIEVKLSVIADLVETFQIIKKAAAECHVSIVADGAGVCGRSSHVHNPNSQQDADTQT